MAFGMLMFPPTGASRTPGSSDSTQGSTAIFPQARILSQKVLSEMINHCCDSPFMPGVVRRSHGSRKGMV